MLLASFSTLMINVTDLNSPSRSPLLQTTSHVGRQDILRTAEAVSGPLDAVLPSPLPVCRLVGWLPCLGSPIPLSAASARHQRGTRQQVAR